MGVVADVYEGALLFAAAMSLVFVAVYTAVAPWWRHESGRSIVAFDAAVFLALLPGVLHYVAGLSLRHVFFAWYSAGSLLSAGLITAWRTAVIVRVQRRAAKAPDSGQSI